MDITSQFNSGLDALIAHNEAYNRALKAIREYRTTLEKTVYSFLKRTDFDLVSSTARLNECALDECFSTIEIGGKTYTIVGVYEKLRSDDMTATFSLIEQEANRPDKVIFSLSFGKEKNGVRPSYNVITQLECPYRKALGDLRSETWKEASDDIVSILETAAPFLYLACVDPADKTAAQRERALQKNKELFSSNKGSRAPSPAG